MSDIEQRTTNPQHKSAQKDLVSNTLWGIATWPLIEGISSVVDGGKFFSGIKDSVATKRGLLSTVSFGALTGIASTLINAALGKYKKPTVIIHQTTNHCPPSEQQPAMPAGSASESPKTLPIATDPTTTHTTTTVFADREEHRREAAATAQPGVA